MLITTIDQFISYVPTAEGSEWKTIEPYIISADLAIKSQLTGTDLYTYIAALTAGNDLKNSLTKLIAVTAYVNAIPFVDLIQTPNGFGIVSNTNIAPASKERVERLVKQCEKVIDSTADLLIQLVMDTPAALAEWKKFKRFNNLTNCLFLTGMDFANSAETDGSRAAFLKVKGALVGFQKNELAEHLSVDYVDALITANRTNSLSEKDAYVVEVCKLALAHLLAKNKHAAEELITGLVVMMERSITDYPIYAASAEYALKNVVPYRNEADHSTFFFGR